LRDRSISKSACVSRSRKTLSLWRPSAPCSIFTKTAKGLKEPVFDVTLST